MHAWCRRAFVTGFHVSRLRTSVCCTWCPRPNQIQHDWLGFAGKHSNHLSFVFAACVKLAIFAHRPSYLERAPAARFVPPSRERHVSIVRACMCVWPRMRSHLLKLSPFALPPSLPDFGSSSSSPG
ncbi:hypothetical protein EV126DRAFT_28069 [Verticillium dahliae]|nr:hypothetical protein EV126DRAFT_28069 [Verticillium dahliae]